MHTKSQSHLKYIFLFFFFYWCYIPASHNHALNSKDTSVQASISNIPSSSTHETLYQWTSKCTSHELPHFMRLVCLRKRKKLNQTTTPKCTRIIECWNLCKKEFAIIINVPGLIIFVNIAFQDWCVYNSSFTTKKPIKQFTHKMKN
jgi:invasion protein IalB